MFICFSTLTYLCNGTFTGHKFRFFLRENCDYFLILQINHVFKIHEPRHVISNNVAFLTCVDSDEPVQPPVKLRYSKCCWSVAKLQATSKCSDQTARIRRLA